MPESKVLLTLLLYAAITGVLNLLLSERSRVDAWAESHPKLAAGLKLLRGLGLDPWHLVAAASLFFRGKLPGGGGGGSSGGSGGGGTINGPAPVKIQPWPDSPDEPAEFRVLRNHDWWSFVQLQMKKRGVFLVVGALALLSLACGPAPLPCDESKLRAADAAFVARVAAECLEYPTANDCPAYPALKADHRAELQSICP